MLYPAYIGFRIAVTLSLPPTNDTLHPAISMLYPAYIGFNTVVISCKQYVTSCELLIKYVPWCQMGDVGL